MATTTHPPGSLRARAGFDRVYWSDGWLDLERGMASQLAAAIEDGVLRGIWVTTIYGARLFAVLSKIESLSEFTPESLRLLAEDDALYAEQERERKLTGSDEDD
jgi:hypothetical protein